MATLRVSGFSSGLDIDSIVKSMMTAKRVPIDKLTQQKQSMEWQRDNYREINSKFVDFKTNKLTAYQKSTAMNTQSATVTGDTTAFKAEASADANNVNMEIKVTQLARPATLQTSGATMSKDGGTRLTSSSTLAALQKQSGGTEVETYTVTINNTKISLASNLTINEAVAKINGTDGANVMARFDEITGKLSIESKTYSSTAKLTVSDDNSFLKLFGGKVTPAAEDDTNNDGIFDYKPAKIEVKSADGTTTALQFDSNSIRLNGISITLLSENKTATVTTSTDPAKALESIKNFVSDYNTLLSTLTTKVNEERDSDYLPLTTEQKAEMSESQIEAWEKRAKSGLLRNDEILKSTIVAMRSALTEKLGQLSAFGITTGQYYENGKLTIDEEKLNKALTENPQGVVSVFQGASGSSSPGLFSKLTTEMTNAIEKLSIRAGTSKFSADLTADFKIDSMMGKELSDYTKRISNMQNRLDDYEDSLYRRFTAMETAINQYNSQSSSLASYMSS
ncbi:flagellar filament capping protein FliD [Paenibacillus tepidiphilus]|uniref:flagellar filament capping protein FliD n=1 Tax=Paenibacillus tepidiphilus TaxID=2608683 RepID=UPI00123C55D5|nr:flagellar filament capping protein FliD [Paenibacillus tepidiphilus]